MQNIEQKTPLANNHISVDCVVIGFDGEQLKVLLIKRAGEEEGEIFHDMKLPGSLIYMDEDLDEAAKRVLNELTGLKNVNLMQFKAFGSKNRTKDPRDVHWLERAMQSKATRLERSAGAPEEVTHQPIPVFSCLPPFCSNLSISSISLSASVEKSSIVVGALKMSPIPGIYLSSSFSRSV